MDPRDIPLLDELTGQVALVSGANRGIGKAIAAGLVDAGATVYAGVRDPANLDATEGQIPVRLDVMDDATIAAAVKRIQDDMGRLDVVVNNAGIAEPWGTRLDNIDMQLFERVMRTNLRGAVALTHAALPLLLKNEGSRIVNMSSGMGAMGEGMSGGNPAYRISKAGLNAFTVYLDADYRDKGLIANVMCPGWVHTDMGGSNAPRTPEKGAETALWLAKFAPDAAGGVWYRDQQPIDW